MVEVCSLPEPVVAVVVVLVVVAAKSLALNHKNNDIKMKQSFR